MKGYTCVYEVRKANSDGMFWPMERVILAHSVKSAMARAFVEIHGLGYETRNPISCFGPDGQRFTGGALAAAMRGQL